MAVSKQKINTFFNNRSKPNISSLISTTSNNKQKKEIPVSPEKNINTNLKQKDIKEKAGPNQAQTRPKPGPNQAQIRPKPNPNQAQIRPKSDPNQAQIRPKPSPENQLIISFYKLTGLQRKAVIFIYNECKKFRTEISRPITLSLFAENIETTKNAAKRAIERLEKKGGIIRHSFQIGRGGWTKYKLPDFIYTEIVDYENTSTDELFCKNNKHKLGPKLSTSSRSNIITTTNLYENINLGNIKNALKLSHIPNGQFFDKGNLKAIFNASGGKLTPEQIQLSIDSFAYGLEYCFDTPPYKTMKEPGAVLFKKLKQGDVWDEPRYLAPAEQEIKKYYDNICVAFLKNEKEKFGSWVKANRDVLLKKFQAKLSSTYHLSESEFMDKAVKEFKESVLPELKISHALDMLGEDKKELLQKIERLKLN